MTPQKILMFKDDAGHRPIIQWLDSFKDKKTQSIIVARINRLYSGILGDWREVGCGVYELRIHYGSGFRIYFAFLQKDIMILLRGGPKRLQKKDILKAQEHWRQFQDKNLKLQKI